jgi:formate dehydrogenase accessory protein FdhD
MQQAKNLGTNQVQLIRAEHGIEREESIFLADEVPVSLTFNGLSHAVLMATPSDLMELMLGFSLSEGIVDAPKQIYETSVIQHEQGYEVSAQISSERFAKLKERRRNLRGATGCGLCGVEALASSALQIPRVTRYPVTLKQILKGFEELTSRQPLNQLSGALHAAGWLSSEGLSAVFEDVGRHNALDKLIGWRALNQPTAQGAVLMTSRVSYELVQKCAQAQIGTLCAVSAPTSLATQLVIQSGMGLGVFARGSRISWIN